MKIECAISSGGGRASSSSEIDIPKELFDFSRSLGSGWFAAEAGFESETPLFYFHVSRSGGGMIGASTVPELLEKNPKGDFLIAYLRDKKNYRPAKAAAPAKATAPALPPPPPPR